MPRSLVLFSALLLMICVTELRAASLASSDFNFQYNPGAASNTTFTANGPWVVDPSISGNVLSFQTSVSGGSGFFLSNDWDAAVSSTTGWTVEISAKVGTDAAQGPSGALNLVAGDGTIGEKVLDIGQSFTADRTTVVDTQDNTAAFHTFRIAMDGTTDVATAWRDGVLLGTFSAPSSQAFQELYFGDGSGTIGGPTVFVQYVRFDTLGAFAPVSVPEPATIVMLGVGAVSVIVFGRRHQRAHR